MAALRNRSGAIVILVALLLLGLFAIAALALDFSRLWALRNELQVAADAAAHAGAIQLIPPRAPANALDSATAYARRNLAMQDTVVIDSLEFGGWNDATRVFTSLSAGAPVIDAVSIVVSRQSKGLVTAAIGVAPPRIKARAVGWASGGSSPGYSRFLVDNEMFDPGMQWIKNLTSNPDSMLSDNNGDWFVDLPVGLKVEVPTGQVGDEALFDITNPAFPFSQTSSPSFADFLNFNEDGSWRQSLIPKSMLDPLTGVTQVDNPSLYPNYVSPGKCQVSPLYKSDISDVNVPPNSVNALGFRRGLVTFSVDSVGIDPDGPSGSKLPNLWITICPPIPSAQLSGVTIGPGILPRPVLAR